MGNLFAVEIETVRGTRKRIYPEGAKPIMSESEARPWFLACLSSLKGGQPVEKCSARFTDSIYLVNVDAHGKRVSDAETRRKHWGWKSEPLGVAA